MRTDARPVIVFDLMAAKPVWHLPKIDEHGMYLGPVTVCGVEYGRPYPGRGQPVRRDHASKIGRQCDRCAKMES